MGIVAKQSILNTLITYLGIIFGAVNTLFLFTYILGAQEYGVVSYLSAAANLMWPLLAFGLPNTLVKFHNTFTSKQDQDSFFSWILLVPILLLIGVVGAYLIFNDEILAKFTGENDIVIPYLWTIIVLGILSAYFELFYAWSKAHLQTIGGNLIKEMYHRVITTIFLVAVYFKYLTPSQFIYSLMFIYLSRTLLMVWSGMKIKSFKFSLKKIENVNSIAIYSVLILISATVSVFLLDLDKVMIENLAPPIANVAKYSICIYVASVIGVPTRAMVQITNPLTAQLLVKGDKLALNVLNKKSSVTALIITVWVGLVVVCNAFSIFELVPPNYELYIEIVFLIGLVKLFDASLGITNAILFNSDSYKWILFFGVAILGLAYFFNTIFIKSDGIVGAAFATFLAYTLYNIAKLAFVYFKHKIQPFSLPTISILLIAIVIWFVFYYWYIANMHAILSIFIKGTLISIVYFCSIYFLKLSPEVNNAIKKIIFRTK